MNTSGDILSEITPAAGNRTSAEVACVRTYLLEHTLDQPFAFSQWRYTRRQNLLVEVIDDDGVTGWGECYGPAAVIQSAIDTFYAPLLLGWPALNGEAFWRHAWRASLDFARKGVMMAAMSGLDMALFDLRGRRLNLSASECMGGRLRESVGCYATGMYYLDVSDDRLIGELIDEALGYQAAGFDALKIKVGKRPDFDETLIVEMRKALPDAQLMADSNHAYDLPEAVRIGRVLDDHSYGWFEEPLSPQRPEMFARLAEKIDTPIAAGECEQTRWGFDDLIKPGGIAIAQPDLAYCGGITEALKIRAITSAAGINTVPHAWGTMLNLASALHFLANTPVEPGRAETTPPMLELDRTPNPMRDEMFSEPLHITGGVARVPTGPGLGVAVDRLALGRLCKHSTEAR